MEQQFGGLEAVLLDGVVQGRLALDILPELINKLVKNGSLPSISKSPKV